MDAPLVTYVGGPTILLEVGGLRFLTDPTFDPAGSRYKILEKTAGPALSPAALGRVDVVLLSHDQHADNLDDEGRRFLAQVPLVLTTASGAARLSRNAFGLAPWETAVAPGGSVKITATPARHGPPGCEPVMGDVIGFLVEWSEKRRTAVYISGDTVFYEGVAEVGRRFSVGTAVLHLGDAHVAIRGPDRLTMNADEAVLASRALRPRTIVPVHYEQWAHFQEPRARAEPVLAAAKLTAKVLWLEPGVPTGLDA